MAETSEDFGEEHIVIRLEANGPVELGELQESLAALARIYNRHHVTEGIVAPSPKLYITKISSGSIILEIVPLVQLLGMPLSFMDNALIVKQFTEWMGSALKFFSGTGVPTEAVVASDARDLNAFVRPLTGRRGAELGITHAKFHKTETDGTTHREIIAEYDFDETSINRASANLNRYALEAESTPDPKSTRTVREVLMYFDQASRGPAKERGRTGDRAVIEDVSKKALPVYFPQEAANIKRRILEQTENPFSMGYIVDVVVNFVDTEPKLYSVINLHETVPLDDE